MSTTRRDFLRASAGMGAAVFAAGCASRGGWFCGTQGAPMHGFAAPKIPHIRLGVVGMGSRGCGVVGRVCNLPGITVTAICDNVSEKIARAQKILSNKKKTAEEFEYSKDGMNSVTEWLNEQYNQRDWRSK